MPLNQFVVKPGYDKQNSEVGAVARWIDGNNVRFRYGLPEKVGGWAAKGSTTLNAVSRKLFPFRDNSGNKYLAIGMDKFLLIYFEGNFYDITPFRSSGYPPTIDEFALSTFTTVSGSNSVTITTTSINKLSVGDIVEFENVSLPAGTGYNNSDFEDKLFEVKTTPTSTTFTVQLTGNASGNVGPGGSCSIFPLETIGNQIQQLSFGVITVSFWVSMVFGVSITHFRRQFMFH